MVRPSWTGYKYKCWSLCLTKKFNVLLFSKMFEIIVLLKYVLLKSIIFQHIKSRVCYTSLIKMIFRFSSCKSWSIWSSSPWRTLKLEYLSIISEHLLGFGPTLAHEKFRSMFGLNIAIETVRRWMTANELNSEFRDPSVWNAHIRHAITVIA